MFSLVTFVGFGLERTFSSFFRDPAVFVQDAVVRLKRQFSGDNKVYCTDDSDELASKIDLLSRADPKKHAKTSKFTFACSSIVSVVLTLCGESSSFYLALR